MATDPMLVFPLDVGFFEIDNTLTQPNEYQIADTSAFVPLSRYRVTDATDRNAPWQVPPEPSPLSSLLSLSLLSLSLSPSLSQRPLAGTARALLPHRALLSARPK
jgi:hypothetical protein